MKGEWTANPKDLFLNPVVKIFFFVLLALIDLPDAFIFL